MKTKLTLLALSVMAALGGQYTVKTFFDGTYTTTVTGSRTNYAFVLPVGPLTAVTTVEYSNAWTKPTLLSAGDGTTASATFVFGGRYGLGTNRVTLSSAGSNDANGVYVYAPATGDTFGTRYTNDFNHAILRLGSYWICTNAQGETNYRVPTALGLNGGAWAVVLPGVAPVPTSAFTDTTGGGPGTVLSLVWSPDGSNHWGGWRNLTNTQNSTNWCTNAWTTTFTNGYFAVYAGTNVATNGAALTNAYLRAYYSY